MTLLKYTTPENCIKILESCSVRFTQPIIFNDPFDSSPLIQNIYNEDDLPHLFDKAVLNNKAEVEGVIIRSFDETIKNFYPEIVIQLSKEEKLTFFFENMYKEAKNLNDFVMNKLNRKEFKEMSINNLIQNIALMTGVFSLTKNPTNLLMWAHYANSHTGFVLEFDISNPFFNTVENNLYPTYIETKYSKKRPIINASFFNATTSDLFKYFKLIFFTKSIDWSYEQEVRILRQLTEQSDSGSTDLNGYPVHLFSFPMNSLKSISIGSRTKPEVVNKVKEILSTI